MYRTTQRTAILAPRRCWRRTCIALGANGRSRPRSSRMAALGARIGRHRDLATALRTVGERHITLHRLRSWQVRVGLLDPPSPLNVSLWRRGGASDLLPIPRCSKDTSQWNFDLDLFSSATAPILRVVPLGGESGRTFFAFLKPGCRKHTLHPPRRRDVRLPGDPDGCLHQDHPRLGARLRPGR